MSLAPWRIPLAKALHLNRSLRESRYLQLATITPQGLPSNRTVVYRDFLEQGNQLKIVTDNRSEKIEHIKNLPWGEACWYFTKTREQFRLAGKLTLITIKEDNKEWQQARINSWLQLSEAAKQQFYWPHPKQARNLDNKAFLLSEISLIEPPDNFCLLLLDPQEVDHLELRGEPQNRTIYTINDSQNWINESVNP